jgi:hypothetical protein
MVYCGGQQEWSSASDYTLAVVKVEPKYTPTRFELTPGLEPDVTIVKDT